MNEFAVDLGDVLIFPVPAVAETSGILALIIKEQIP
jgi:hypothetical protein